MKLKKVISIILTAALVLQMCTFAAFADNEAELQGDSVDYVALCDKTLIDGYNYGIEVESLYPSLLAEKLDWNLTKIYGIENTSTLLEKLGEVIPGDYTTLNMGTNDLLASQWYKDMTLPVDAFGMIIKQILGLVTIEDEAWAAFAKYGLDKNDSNKVLIEKIMKAMIDSSVEVRSGNYLTNSNYIATKSLYSLQYEAIVDGLKDKTGQLILVGCYNPFNTGNAAIKAYDAICKGDMWARACRDTEVFKEIMASFIEYVPKAEQQKYYSALQTEAELMDEIVEEPVLQDEISEKDKYTLVRDMLYMATVFMYGGILDEAVNEFNKVAEACASEDVNDNITYVDVPVSVVHSSSYDFYPNSDGHKYIAEQIYNGITFKCNAQVMGYGGSITCDNGSKRHIVGSNAEYTITPSQNYQIDKVTVNGKCVSVTPDPSTGVATYTVENIQSDQNIFVSFKYSNTKSCTNKNTLRSFIKSYYKLSPFSFFFGYYN